MLPMYLMPLRRTSTTPLSVTCLFSLARKRCLVMLSLSRASASAVPGWVSLRKRGQLRQVNAVFAVVVVGYCPSASRRLSWTRR